ncbi:hypothetical protein AOLI_G00005590 [Acnodon oligacanthus]
MPKPKKVDKGDDESDEPVNSPGKGSSPSSADIMAAIQQLSEKVDHKFTLMSSSVSNLQEMMANVNTRVLETEQAVDDHEKCIHALELKCCSLAADKRLLAKMEDLECRSRRQNIHRPFINRIHHYQVKEFILRLARQCFPLEYNGSRVFIFPDFSPDIIKKWQASDAIKKKCKESANRYGFRFPTRFRITVGNTSGIFDLPNKAESFL